MSDPSAADDDEEDEEEIWFTAEELARRSLLASPAGGFAIGTDRSTELMRPSLGLRPVLGGPLAAAIGPVFPGWLGLIEGPRGSARTSFWSFVVDGLASRIEAPITPVMMLSARGRRDCTVRTISRWCGFDSARIRRAGPEDQELVEAGLAALDGPLSAMAAHQRFLDRLEPSRGVALVELISRGIAHWRAEFDVEAWPVIAIDRLEDWASRGDLDATDLVRDLTHAGGRDGWSFLATSDGHPGLDRFADVRLRLALEGKAEEGGGTRPLKIRVEQLALGTATEIVATLEPSTGRIRV